MNPHAAPKLSPVEMVHTAFVNQHILYQLIKREIYIRYQGSVLGLVWSFVTPLIMLAVYTFFFSVVFKAKWGIEDQSSQVDFALILFVGLIIHTLFTECINRAPTLVLSNANYVKKIIFPLEVLPWLPLGSALFHALISFTVLMAAQFFIYGQLPWTIVFLPAILIPFLFILLGGLWFLSAIGVYVRDINQTTGLVCSIMLFISPVFYSLSMLPENIRQFAYFNPLTLIIIELRKILLFTEIPDWSALGLYTLISIVFAWSGFITFQKTRKGFADVI